MIYDQIVRVNQIDTEINGLHQHLARLYEERQAIMVPAKPSVKLAQTVEETPQAVYKTLAATWQTHGVKLPSFARLKVQIQTAQTIAAALPTKSTIVVVPPQRMLKKAMETPRPTFSDPVFEKFYKKSAAWEVLVVIDKDQHLPTNNLQQFIEAKEYMYEAYDCRGLGLQGLWAYGLQTGNWPANNEWILLLNEIKDDHVLCALKHGDELLIDRDASACLIGDNFFKAAIVAGEKTNA